MRVEPPQGQKPPSRVIVFDMDDTLYLERDFCLSGFAAVDRWLEEEHGTSGLADVAEARLDSGDRGNIFDLALRDLGMVPDATLVQAMVAVYRDHAPRISLAPDAADFLAAARPDHGYALLSDGPLRVQQGKIHALGLATHRMNPLMCTDAFGRAFWKPHPRGYEFIEKAFRLPSERFVYVADNPAKDFVVPRARGWRSVQICRPRRIHADVRAADGGEADCRIETLAELDAVL